MGWKQISSQASVGAVYDRPRSRKQGLSAVTGRRYSKAASNGQLVQSRNGPEHAPKIQEFLMMAVLDLSAPVLVGGK